MVNQSVVPVNLESLPEDRSYLSAIFTLRLYPLYLYIMFKHYLLILPIFVAIDFLGSHIVYLVLSLKLGATKWYQSNADCRTQA